VQCSVAGATLEAWFEGSQGALGTGGKTVDNGRLTAQGTQGVQTCQVAGDGYVLIKGIMVTPGSGSPTIGIQAKGVQVGSSNVAIRANSYLRVTRIS
jgi:hypothetical protein